MGPLMVSSVDNRELLSNAFNLNLVTFLGWLENTFFGIAAEQFYWFCK